MKIEIADRIKDILVLEDEALVALQIEDLAREMGAQNVHVCGNLAEGLEVAKNAQLDCALLDLMLPDGRSTEIADILLTRGIPFVFSTGSGVDDLPERHRSRPLITKPFADDDLKRILLDACYQSNA